MTKIKIVYPFMPWEIDYALFSFTQLKKSLYYIPEDVEIIVETDLNLSSHVIDWNNSKLLKKELEEKVSDTAMSLLAKNIYNNRSNTDYEPLIIFSKSNKILK